jgi:hypothetical protein
VSLDKLPYCGGVRTLLLPNNFVTGFPSLSFNVHLWHIDASNNQVHCATIIGL